MAPELVRWVIGFAVLAHGIGHVLFMPLVAGVTRLHTDGHSWLLTNLVGEGPTKTLATLVAAVAGIAFVACGIAITGIAGQAGWWRGVAVAASIASLTLVVVMWDGIPTSSAFFAVMFDLVVLAALLVARWPSAETIGS